MYEAKLSNECLERIWSKLKTKQKKDKSLTLYATATFDHEIIHNGIHEWLMRRWNSFNVSMHSCIALLLAYPIGKAIKIAQTKAWWISTIVISFILIINGIIAWHETMAMLEFQTHREIEKEKS